MAQPLIPLEQVGAKRAGTHAGGIRQKYFLDEPSRRLILAMYDGTSERITELQRKLGVPRWKVKDWARQLGLSARREPPWSEEEIQYLERNLHRVSLANIAKHLGRTKTAVQIKAKRLGINKCFQEGYTLRGLALGLGCDAHKVLKWIDKGWIKGIHRGTERTEVQGGDVWFFGDTAIREFIRTHPEEIDLRRVDKYWFLDLAFGGKDGIGALDNQRSR